MHSRANDIAGELAVLDEKIRVVKIELNMLKEQRSALVDRLAGIVEASRPVRLTTPLGPILMKQKHVVTFPTQSTDPAGHDRLVHTIRERGGWMKYSTVNYPRLKSDWLHGRVEDTIREPLRPLAREHDELVVTSPRRGPDRSTGDAAPGRAF
ncbi:MAG: hypothetical protein K8E66_10815 [Phycisphaerales bacterium]|nr:hypothetical protein [Phycisphaerales bacterium]